MKTLRTGLSLGIAAIAAMALPAAAAAEYLVPPGNSAATQYTETLPTAGGHGDTEKAGKGKRSPTDVLGEDDAKKLHQQGQSGREVAEFTAETAPSEEARSPEPESGDGGAATDQSTSQRDDDAGAGAGGTGKGGPPGAPPEIPAPEAAGPEGSSGLGEVIAQATGSSSSGQLGLLLPLALVAAIAWALAFLWRQRSRSTV